MSRVDVALVTATNSKYFPLAKGLICSLLDGMNRFCTTTQICNNQSFKKFPIHVANWHFSMAVLDGGLTEHERKWLEDRNIVVQRPEEPTLDFEHRHIAPHMIGFTERHALPTHFPGYQLYMWMDADTWVQDFERGVMPYLLIAARKHLTIVPEVNRQIAFNDHYRNVTVGWSVGNYTKYFGSAVADVYSAMPMFNSGVFAARVDNPVWELWASAMQFALDANLGKPEFGIDQISLNYTIYTNKDVQPYPLPLSCNWMVTHAMPMIDEVTDQLVMPLWPHTPIGIVHLLDNTKWNRVGINRFKRDMLSVTSGDSVYLDYFSMTKRVEE